MKNKALLLFASIFLFFGLFVGFGYLRSYEIIEGAVGVELLGRCYPTFYSPPLQPF